MLNYICMKIKEKLNWLITGGAGFIGSHIAHLLVLNKQKVIIFDNLSTGNLDNIKDIKGNITFIKGDITNKTDLEKLPKNIDYILHLAAQISVPKSVENPQETFFTNTQGTLNVLEFAKNIQAKKIVLSSSAAIYGDKTLPPCKENAKPACQSPYAISKLQGEEMLKMYNLLYNLPTAILRYFNVFGPYQSPNNAYASVIAKFVDCFIKKQPLTIFGDGKQTRDFVFVKDIARANIFAALNLDKGEVYNIAAGEHRTLLELVEILNNLFGYKAQINFAPARLGDIKASFADISKITAAGFKPEYTLATGLREMLKNMGAL
ncbi:MAG: NAD-dependent epimerase/dehydratase family protein [Campylobacter sp.]|nr:NAD-dependent epimerase/dehydratase family protein [Campylobacter sp.]